jgi:hypothetical protein
MGVAWRQLGINRKKMGTTLTGTTPQDTYDSLIKVTDNGPLSGTLKALSDGLGNDSTLSLSTTAASIAGTLAVTGNTGIGTSTPDQIGYGAGKILGVLSPAADATNIQLGIVGSSGATTGTLADINFFGKNGTGAVVNRAILRGGIDGATDSNFISAWTMSAGTLNERFRITSNGVTFNGDTAAANALDDYEEGTWTMGVSFDGASAGVTTSINTGTYTKIGRKVTVNGQITLTSKGSSTGVANITGLPFTIANSSGNYSAPSFWFTNITFANQFIAYGIINTTSIDLSEITEAGVVSGITNADFANNSSIIVSFTYFV